MINREILRFGCVGIAATTMHLFVSALLLWMFPRMALIVVNTMAFFAAFSISYVGHRYYTFSRKGSPIRFFATSLTGLGINNSIVLIASSLTGARFLSIVIGTAIAPFLVFLLSKFWAFKVE